MKGNKPCKSNHVKYTRPDARSNDAQPSKKSGGSQKQTYSRPK